MSRPLAQERRPATHGTTHHLQTAALDDDRFESTPYQLLPDLTAEEYAALRGDIAEHGIRVPVDVDEADNILDGHHRARIAAELGLPLPKRVVFDLDEAGKRAHALAVNVHRRSLTADQRDDLVRRLRADGLSTRAIAETLRVGKGTVARATAGAPGGAPAAVTGQDGKQYPASRPRFHGDGGPTDLTTPVAIELVAAVDDGLSELFERSAEALRLGADPGWLLAVYRRQLRDLGAGRDAQTRAAVQIPFEPLLVWLEDLVLSRSVLATAVVP